MGFCHLIALGQNHMLVWQRIKIGLLRGRADDVGPFRFTVERQKAGTEMTPIDVWTVNKTPGEHRPSRVVDCLRPMKADHHGPNTQTEKAARGRRFRARRDRNVRDFLAGSAKVTSRRVSGLANGSPERASQSACC